MSSEPYIGSVKTFAFSFPPRGYMTCQGQILSVSQNTALFSLLGTTYGGNGSTTFGLPDLRGRLVNGQGQGQGLPPYQMGQIAGTPTTTLLQSQMPQHIHTFTNNGSTLNAVQTRGTDQAPDTGSQLARAVDPNGGQPQIYVPTGTTGTQVALGGVNVAGTIGIAGGSQPFGIEQPYLTMNFSIAVQGLFPSRN